MADADSTTCTEHEVREVAQANATGKQPVVFVHGLWLLPSSWDRWREVFEEAGYVTLAPGRPDDPDTVEEAKEHPEVFAHKSVGQIADHFDEVISAPTAPSTTSSPASRRRSIRALRSPRSLPATPARPTTQTHSSRLLATARPPLPVSSPDPRIAGFARCDQPVGSQPVSIEGGTRVRRDQQHGEVRRGSTTWRGPWRVGSSHVGR